LRAACRAHYVAISGNASEKATIAVKIGCGYNLRRGFLESRAVVILESTITCPGCGHAHLEIMPMDACQYYYECQGCRTLLRPKPGHCCVFCSYGSVVCPPIQESKSCCAKAVN
jgi:hypothetical protein